MPIEAMQFAKRIRVRGFTGEEQRQFELLIRALSSLTERQTALARGRFELAAKLESLVHSELDQLEIEFVQVADAFADCFRKGMKNKGDKDGCKSRVHQIYVTLSTSVLTC